MIRDILMEDQYILISQATGSSRPGDGYGRSTTG
jgi:hypothetical protein